MAEEAAAAAKAAAETDKKAGGSNLVTVVSAALVSGGILLGGLYYLMSAQNKTIKDALEAAAKKSPDAAAAAQPASVKDADAAFYDLDEFLVNLSNPGGGRYLRTTVSLRFQHEAQRDAIKKEQPKVRDAIIEIFTSHSTQDLATREGKEKLKVELLTQLNKLLPDAGFDGVYFQTFTVQ